MSLRRALVGFVAAGCLFLMIEILISHREVFGEKPVAWSPIIVSVLGLLTSLWAFARWQPLAQKAFQVVCFLLLIVGLAGLYFHNHELFEGEHKETEGHAALGHEKGEGRGEEHHAPPFAPLSLSGMGILGLMATYPKWKQDE
ncbi:MAG: hypothetical protein NZ805_10420 [Armatimonadetes bacterium]|nr:hypothetical protein [Armatimonadota bacterium]MDW8029030.1 hypothetical protein [Armatimonadota bacterium]